MEVKIVQDNVIKKADQWFMNTYSPFPIVIDHGVGSTLWDMDGKKYIDFTSGIGVTSIGYGNEDLYSVVAQQAKKLTHISNLFYNEPSAKLAKKLCTLTKMNKVFFSNSGAEANEGAIKLARKYSFDKYGPNRHNIITLKKSFQHWQLQDKTIFINHFFLLQKDSSMQKQMI